jgi:hypothetical protein
MAAVRNARPQLRQYKSEVGGVVTDDGGDFAPGASLERPAERLGDRLV